MKLSKLFQFFLIGVLAPISAAEPLDLEKMSAELDRLIKAECAKTISVSNSKPQKRITNLMVKIDKIGQELMAQPPVPETLKLSQKCLALMAALRERRAYSYMLWAEGQLEGCSRGKYVQMENLQQSELLRLYEILGEINTSLLQEPMLTKEILSKISAIYEQLSPDNKRVARVRAIHQQRDPLSSGNNVKVRKTYDDF